MTATPRVAAAFTGVAVASALLLSAAPVPAATTVLCGTPHITQVSPQIGRAGDTVTVSGAGFASLTCQFSIAVGGQRPPFRYIGDSSATFTSTGSLNGGVTAMLTDSLGGTNPSNSNLVFATVPTVTGLAPAAPVENQAVAVAGSGFTFGGMNPAVGAVFQSGGGTCQNAAPSVQSDSSITVSAPGRYCDGPLQLVFNVVTDTGSGSVQQVGVTAGSIDIAPSVASVSPRDALPGAVVTVSGSGFGGGGSATVSGVGARVSWQDRSIGITVPADAVSGPVALARSGDGVAIAAGSVTVDSVINTITPPNPAIGDSITIAGLGFGPQKGSVHLGTEDLPIAQWSSTAITAGIPPGSVTGDLLVKPVGNPAPLQPHLVLAPRLTSVVPGHAQAGAVIVINGTSLGTATGAVSIGGHPADVSLWADQQVGVVVPGGLKPGPTQIVVAPLGGIPATTGFVVDAGPAPPSATPGAPGAAGTPGATAAPAAVTSGGVPPPPPIAPVAGGPAVTHGGAVDFHPQRKPPSPINLTLVPSADRAEPGATVSLTASLVAFGKPVVGAPIQMLIVVEPDRDASVTPVTATTDARGEIHGSIHLSRTVGDHILLARSGLYSDEVRIRGGSEAALTGSAITAVRTPIVWGVSACIVLFVLGFALNLATSPGAARAAVVAWKARAPGARGIPPAAWLVIVAVVLSAVAGWRSAVLRTVARIRRSRDPSVDAIT